MTVALKNVDFQLLDVLRSLARMRNIEIFQVNDDVATVSKINNEISEEESLKKMRESSLKTVWETLKNDSW